MSSQTLCDLADLSAALGVTIRWLKAEARAGRIPHLRAGRKLLFDRTAVTRALAARARCRPPTSEAAHA